MRSTSGQATVDYVAIIAVLAIVLSAALAAAALGAPGIVNAVAGQFRHALCLVGGRSCPDPRSKPCAVATTRDARHIAVNLLVVRLDDNRYVLRELMSDGTVRLTVARSNAAGVELGIGADAHATVAGRKVGASDEVRVGGQLVYGSGDVFVARDEREAERFMKAIRDDRDPASPREDFHEGGVRGLATLGIGSSLAGASLEALGARLIGVRRDLRSGESTLTLNAGGNGWGAISLGLGEPAGSIDASATFGLTLDRDRRPTQLSIAVAGTAGSGGSLPLVVQRSLRQARGDARGAYGSLSGGRWELDARLDLRDPVVAATWARFRRDPTSRDSMRDLGAAIRDRAHVDVRTYGTAGTSSGAGAGISEGVRLGGEYQHTIDRSRLLAASSRPPAGLWEPRLDCASA